MKRTKFHCCFVAQVYVILRYMVLRSCIVYSILLTGLSKHNNIRLKTSDINILHDFSRIKYSLEDSISKHNQLTKTVLEIIILPPNNELMATLLF